MYVGKNDTIAAIATARGTAALAIVRTSGPRAVEFVDACFEGRTLTSVASHTAHVGFITTRDGEEIDQVVVTVFRAPQSVTGEDVVEISCHGGDFASSLILSRLIEVGARMAEPGEFTQRSFLHGKMDLAQAEAVADLIHASSSLSHRVSLAQLKGRYSTLIDQLRQDILELAAYVELELDFSEEDVAFADRDRLVTLLGQGQDLLGRLLASYRTGEMVREGVRVVIGGRPNAGKSTLLNALVGSDRAIVNEQPGTTRDEITADVEIDGVRFRFPDTAGLRETVDQIEAEGVARARRAIESADVVVYAYDLRSGLDAAEVGLLEDVRAMRPDLAVILVGNKSDLLSDAPAPADPPAQAVEPDFCVSALRGLTDERELRGLVEALVGQVEQHHWSTDGSAVVMNQRHRTHLKRALEAVESAQDALRRGVSGDVLATDLRFALDELGAITGRITHEDVLDQIFSRFCIGK